MSRARGPSEKNSEILLKAAGPTSNALPYYDHARIFGTSRFLDTRSSDI